MEIRDLAISLNEKIRQKIGQLEEIGSATRVMFHLKASHELIEQNMSKMRDIAYELEPVSDIVKAQFPKHYKFFESLILKDYTIN